MSAWLQQDWCLSFVLALGHFLWQGTLIALGLAIALRATLFREPPAGALRLNRFCPNISSDSRPRLSTAIAPQFQSG